MEHNVRGTDRGVRLVVGAVLVALSFMVEWRDYWGLVPFLVGAALLGSVALRYCPVKALLFAGRR